MCTTAQAVCILVAARHYARPVEALRFDTLMGLHDSGAPRLSHCGHRHLPAYANLGKHHKTVSEDRLQLLPARVLIPWVGVGAS
jgi:hypothetical protein